MFVSHATFNQAFHLKIFTCVCTKGDSSKYAYVTQYDRRKLHLPELLCGKLTKRGANVCVSYKMFAPL